MQMQTICLHLKKELLVGGGNWDHNITFPIVVNAGSTRVLLQFFSLSLPFALAFSACNVLLQ
jgi:hypothetical protein